MSKKFLSTLLLSTVLLTHTAFAEQTETNPETEEKAQKTHKGELRANVKRIALDISNTDVDNADQYQGSSISALSADSETTIKYHLDFALEYEQENFQWDNKVQMKYGKTTLKPQGEKKTKSENDDEILLTSEYTQKLWKKEDTVFGPFASIGYQTEFTDNDGDPKTEITRGKAGLKLYNNPYMFNLYGAITGEVDTTHEKTIRRSAWEVGGEFKRPLYEGVKFHAEGFFRDYITSSMYEGSDLRYDLSLTGRLEVKVYKQVNIAPFVSYRMAQSKEAKNTGSNFMVGVCLSYSDLFKIF